jgi:hypothetical protein
VARDFAGEPTVVETITLGGRRLAMMLAWLARTKRVSLEHENDRVGIGMDLDGLGEILYGLSLANLSEQGIENAPVFRFLWRCTLDLAARLQVRDDVDGVLKDATVYVKPATEATR